jgi:hypothetical protein
VEHLGHGKRSDEFATPGVDLPLRPAVRCVILAIGLGCVAGVKETGAKRERYRQLARRLLLPVNL